MLKEITSVTQFDGEPKRRWFEDENFDLIMWQNDAEEIVGFELYYDKFTDQHAMRWEKPAKYAHYRVDEGENKAGKQKSSPILISDRDFDGEKIAHLFKAESRELDKKISRFVFDKILQYPSSSADEA
jgi:hypothetical protein